MSRAFAEYVAPELDSRTDGRMPTPGRSDAARATARPARRPAAEVEVERSLEHVGSDEMYAAASAIPEPARAALWLVVLRRWSYDEAAHAKDIE